MTKVWLYFVGKLCGGDMWASDCFKYLIKSLGNFSCWNLERLGNNPHNYCTEFCCNSFSQTEEVWINQTCLKAKIKASAWKTIRKTQYSSYEDYFNKIPSQIILFEFMIPKKIPKSKISNPKNPSIFFVTWNL